MSTEMSRTKFSLLTDSTRRGDNAQRNILLLFCASTRLSSHKAKVGGQVSYFFKFPVFFLLSLREPLFDVKFRFSHCIFGRVIRTEVSVLCVPLFFYGNDELCRNPSARNYVAVLFVLIMKRCRDRTRKFSEFFLTSHTREVGKHCFWYFPLDKLFLFSLLAKIFLKLVN
jgi:hypothetical protein